MTGARVLLVDDEPAVRRVLARYFTRRGAQVVEAANATEALAHLGECPCSLMVTDVEMPPGASGVWLAATVSERWPEVPVIVVTGASCTDAEVDTIRRCARGLLPKPLDLQELDRCVRDAIVSGSLPGGCSPRQGAERAQEAAPISTPSAS